MGFGWCLAACAGAANTIAFKSWHLYASHVTGSTSAMAFRLEGYHQGEWGSETGKFWCRLFIFKSNKYLCYFLGLIAFRQWLPKQKEQESLKEACLLVLSFLVGAYACGLLIDKNQVHFMGKAFYGLALVLNSSLLSFAAFVPGRLLPVCLVAAACGLQNAMCTSHFGAIIRTTHLTGTVTDIGSTLGRISMIYLRKGCRRSRLDHVERAEVGVDASCSECKVVQVVLWGNLDVCVAFCCKEKNNINPLVLIIPLKWAYDHTQESMKIYSCHLIKRSRRWFIVRALAAACSLSSVRPFWILQTCL